MMPCRSTPRARRLRRRYRACSTAPAKGSPERHPGRCEGGRGRGVAEARVRGKMKSRPYLSSSRLVDRHVHRLAAAQLARQLVHEILANVLRPMRRLREGWHESFEARRAEDCPRGARTRHWCAERGRRGQRRAPPLRRRASRTYSTSHLVRCTPVSRKNTRAPSAAVTA